MVTCGVEDEVVDLYFFGLEDEETALEVMIGDIGYYFLIFMVLVYELFVWVKLIYVDLV